MDNNRIKGDLVTNQGSYANNRNPPSNFCKNYEDHKKGIPHRYCYYICGDTTHSARYCPLLSKLNAMAIREGCNQTGGPFEKHDR